MNPIGVSFLEQPLSILEGIRPQGKQIRDYKSCSSLQNGEKHITHTP